MNKHRKITSADRLEGGLVNPDIFRQLTAPRSVFQGDLKQRFGKQLHHAILRLGINQSEFARRCGLKRDSISTYLLGKTLPSATSAAKMSKVLGVDISQWLDGVSTEEEATAPTQESTVAVSTVPGEAGRAHLRVNKVVKMTTALKVVEMLEADDAPLKGK